MKFSIKDFYSKWDQARRKLQIGSFLLKKSLMENFIFCAVRLTFLVKFVTLILGFYWKWNPPWRFSWSCPQYLERLFTGSTNEWLLFITIIIVASYFFYIGKTFCKWYFSKSIQEPYATIFSMILKQTFNQVT